MWLSPKQRRQVAPADANNRGTPIPTQMVSNGEYMPLRQTAQQALVEHAIFELADKHGSAAGLDRRAFLRTSAGLAASFFAMNKVFGEYFSIDGAEAHDLSAAAAWRARYAAQFIIDVQLHFVRDDYTWEGILSLGEYAKKWNKILAKEKISFELFKFDNFVKEVFFDSDTKIGLVSAAPFDHAENSLLNNDALAATRRAINSASGSRRMMCHSVFAPGQPGWLEEIDRAAADLKPDGWKGYTVGDPFGGSKFPWRMDDEKLLYPAYEKMMKSGTRNVCVHKGLLPAEYETSFTHWEHAMVDDVGKAARDWPDLNFIIYHSGFKPLMHAPDAELKQFDQTGRVDWVTDLAEIPAKFGVKNVYAELGTTFGSCAITHPKLAAALVGTVIRGMGADHVIWGTDSVWYGSPQWQIDAMRRIEIPAKMRKQHHFGELGAADGKVKSAIFAGNAARLFGLEALTRTKPWADDELAKTKADYLAAGGKPSNTFYGFIAKARKDLG